MERNLDDTHKQLLAAAYLARFPDIDAQASKFGW